MDELMGHRMNDATERQRIAREFVDAHGHDDECASVHGEEVDCNCVVDAIRRGDLESVSRCLGTAWRHVSAGLRASLRTRHEAAERECVPLAEHVAEVNRLRREHDAQRARADSLALPYERAVRQCAQMAASASTDGVPNGVARSGAVAMRDRIVQRLERLATAASVRFEPDMPTVGWCVEAVMMLEGPRGAHGYARAGVEWMRHAIAARLSQLAGLVGPDERRVLPALPAQTAPVSPAPELRTIRPGHARSCDAGRALADDYPCTCATGG